MLRNPPRTAWFRLLYALLFSAALLTTFSQYYACSSLNPYALGEAVNNEDLPAVAWLLKQGVSLDGTDNPARYETWGERLLTGLRLKPHDFPGKRAIALAASSQVYHGTGRCTQKQNPDDDMAILQILLEHGADPNACNRSWQSALMEAIITQNLPASKMLLTYHANPDAGGLHHCSPLEQAVGMRDCPTVGLLLDYGADTEQEYGPGSTPLRVACRLYCTNCARVLLERGANPNVKDFMGRTILDNVKSGLDNGEHKKWEMITLLQKSGAR